MTEWNSVVHRAMEYDVDGLESSYLGVTIWQDLGEALNKMKSIFFYHPSLQPWAAPRENCKNIFWRKTTRLAVHPNYTSPSSGIVGLSYELLLKFCGTSVKTILFADAMPRMLDPGSTVSYATPTNPGSGTSVKQL